MKEVRSAAGNRFVTWNVDFDDSAPLDGPLEGAAQAAFALCARHAVDGVIAFARASRDSDADVRLVFFNADGSRPEACGNGLRAAARYAREKAWVARDAFRLQTDAGPREARLLRAQGEVCAAEVSLGAARDHGDVALALEPAALLVPGAARVDPARAASSDLIVAHIELGNPHAVLFVPDPARTPVASLGPAIERHPHFPGRVNVGFAASTSELGGSGLSLRVWERGVGETQACGTGAAAAALAAVGRGRAAWPVAVDLPGGRLVVRAGPSGELWLTGPC